MLQRIFLVRHGEVRNPDEHGMLRSRTPMPLTDAGRDQMLQSGRVLADVPFDHAFCSPLPRCVDSLALLTEGRELSSELLDDLMEVHMGDADGRSLGDVMTLLQPQIADRTEPARELPPDVTFPGGESMQDVQVRALRALDRIVATDHDCILVMTHSGVLRTLVCGILGMPLEHYTRIDQDYGCVNLLHVDDGTPIVKMLNLSVLDPLKGAAPFNQWRDYQREETG